MEILISAWPLLNALFKQYRDLTLLQPHEASCVSAGEDLCCMSTSHRTGPFSMPQASVGDNGQK